GQLDAAGGSQNVFGGARAASTAADQSYIDHVASRSANGGQASESASYRAAHQRHTRLLQEIATRRLSLVFFLVVCHCSILLVKAENRCAGAVLRAGQRALDRKSVV